MLYFAVTKSTPERATAILKTDDSGVIEQYDENLKNWRNADDGMSGIYSGDVECEVISKKQADDIIKMWGGNAD